MKDKKLITYFGDKTLEEMREFHTQINRTWVDGSTGVHSNPNFTWAIGSETNLFDTGTAWKEADDKGVTGTDLEKIEAQELLIPYLKAITVIMKQANVQHPNVESKLASTGGEMGEDGGEVGEMDKAIITSIKPVEGVAGMFKVHIVPSEKFCHGTVVRLTNLASGAVREIVVHEKGIITITDCTPGVHFSIEVAYDGTNPLRKWSDPKPFWGQ